MTGKSKCHSRFAVLPSSKELGFLIWVFTSENVLFSGNKTVNQHLSASPKNTFWPHFDSFSPQNLSKTCKKLKKLKKHVSASFQVHLAPEIWSKYPSLVSSADFWKHSIASRQHLLGIHQSDFFLEVGIFVFAWIISSLSLWY